MPEIASPSFVGWLAAGIFMVFMLIGSLLNEKYFYLCPLVIILNKKDMNTRDLCKVILLAFSSFCFVACGDDNEPVSLIHTGGNETLIDLTSNTLTLSPFSSGESFYINGGDGAYTIDNSNEEVVNFAYDGRTLTLKPLAQGEAVITIQDRDNDTYLLRVVVSYPTESFEVLSVAAEAKGNELTQMETTLLQQQMETDLPVNVGGQFRFTYMVPDSTQGELEMVPAGNALPLKGVFQSATKYFETGTPYTEITVSLTSGDKFVYACYPANADSTYTLAQDVTERYKSAYPKVQQAITYQYIQQATE